MRIEKEKELHNYIEELKTKRSMLLEKYGEFLTVERHLIELNNGEVVHREKLLKNGKDGNASIILPITEDGEVL